MSTLGENFREVSGALLNNPNLYVAGATVQAFNREHTIAYVGPPDEIVTIYTRPIEPEYDVERLNKILIGATAEITPHFQSEFALYETPDRIEIGSLMFNDNFVIEAVGKSAIPAKQGRTVHRLYPSAFHLANAANGINVDFIPLEELYVEAEPLETPQLIPLQSVLMAA